MTRRLTQAICLALLALLAAPGSAAACAALFSPNANVLQSGQSIVFTFDQAQRLVTAYVAVRYTGAAEDFAWVVPMPSNPEVDVTENELFEDLEQATSPVYRFPSQNCNDLRIDTGLGGSAPQAGAPGSVDVYQQGQVGPYDFSVIGGEDAGELSEWLRQNGYRITPQMEPLIKIYTDERMLFLAMKLQGGKEAGDIQPVRMTFSADRPAIPLRLAAVGAEPDTQVRVWLFADRQMAPENAERLVIPDDQVFVTNFSGRDNYTSLVDEAVDQVGGKGLVLEYAQPTSALGPANSAVLAELRQRYPYLTRYYTRLSPEQMTFDPSFVPQDGLPDLSNVHDLTERISPYDCGAREVLDPAEQLVVRGTAQAFWINARGMLPCLAVPTVLVLGLVALVIVVRRRAR
jgi:hypothetical protein